MVRHEASDLGRRHEAHDTIYAVAWVGDLSVTSRVHHVEE